MTTKAQQKRNCRYLAKKLQAIPKKHYDQNSYYRHIGKHQQDKPMPFDCKTKACAWGHAACMPYFNKQGLWLEFGDVWLPVLTYCSRQGRKLFGMTDQIADSIFGTTATSGSPRYDPQAVADKLLAHAKTL